MNDKKDVLFVGGNVTSFIKEWSIRYIHVKPGNKNQMLGTYTYIGFELNLVNNMFFIDTHWKCVLIFAFNRIMELVLDCSYTYPLPFFMKFKNYV